MVRGIPNISVPALSYAMVQGGKMSLPVDSASLLYSHFEYVSGVAAPEGIQGIAISKLNLLDVLIGQLNQLGKSAPPAGVNSGAQNRPAGNGVNALIENYRTRILTAKASSDAMPYLPSPNARPGVLFSLVA